LVSQFATVGLPENTLKIEAKPVDVPAALGFVAKADANGHFI
jgi:hypothetical protein